jgi:hypothetical protein
VIYLFGRLYNFVEEVVGTVLAVGSWLVVAFAVVVVVAAVAVEVVVDIVAVDMMSVVVAIAVAFVVAEAVIVEDFDNEGWVI